MEDTVDAKFTTHTKENTWIQLRNSTYTRKLTKKNVEIKSRSTINKNTIFDRILKHDPRLMAYHQPQTVAVYMNVAF